MTILASFVIIPFSCTVVCQLGSLSLQLGEKMKFYTFFWVDDQVRGV